MKLKIEQTLPLRPVGASLLSKDRILYFSCMKTGVLLKLGSVKPHAATCYLYTNTFPANVACVN